MDLSFLIRRCKVQQQHLLLGRRLDSERGVSRWGRTGEGRGGVEGQTLHPPAPGRRAVLVGGGLQGVFKVTP